MRTRSNIDILQDVKDSVDYILTQDPDEEEILSILINITRDITFLYRRIEEEE